MNTEPFAIDRQTRGSYVRLTGESRERTSYNIARVPQQEYGEWKPFKQEGILTFTREGWPKLNGHCVGDSERLRFVRCEVLWNPPWDSIRHLCRKCLDTHALGIALKDMRTPMRDCYRKDTKCSICGKAGHVHCVPEHFWRFGASMSAETIEKELVSDVFFRKMRDANADLILSKCSRNFFYKHNPRRGKFESVWESKSGDHYHAEHDEPPAGAMWTREVEMRELKEFAKLITADHQIIWEREASA